MLWCCPRRATAIVQAVLVLHHVENPVYQATLLFPAAGHPPTQTNTFMEPHCSSRAARGIRSCRRHRVLGCLRLVPFHDLRHTHKTWMIEDNVPEVAQAKRLGHRLPGVRGIYSHVSPTVEQRLIDALQKRWEKTTQPRPEQ